MSYSIIDYNFDKLKEGIFLLTVDDESHRKEALGIIKDQLNYFFKDFKCTEVLFTLNTDNEFFGIQISPFFKYWDCGNVRDLFNPDIENVFDHYSVEIDSKLFNGDFTVEEVVALLIHDINKVNTSNIIKDVVAAIDCIVTQSGIPFCLNSMMVNRDFLLFAMQDTIRKMTSSFELIPSELTVADEFIRSYGLDRDYERGIDNIKKCRNNLEGQICCTTLTLQWFLSKYIGMTSTEHKDIVDSFKDCINLTGSKLLRRSLKNLICCYGEKGLEKSDQNYYIALSEAAKKRGSLVSQIKYSGLKSLEDDVYEYRMRIRNVETENDAIYIIRQINNRMGIISDYLETEELSDTERERFFKLYDKYDSLREELSKKSVYNRKMYGLFVDYNALQNMSNGSMTMNTYY